MADGLFLKSLTVSGFVVKRKITVGGYSLCSIYVICFLLPVTDRQELLGMPGWLLPVASSKIAYIVYMCTVSRCT